MVRGVKGHRLFSLLAPLLLRATLNGTLYPAAVPASENHLDVKWCRPGIWHWNLAAVLHPLYILEIIFLDGLVDPFYILSIFL